MATGDSIEGTSFAAGGRRASGRAGRARRGWAAAARLGALVMLGALTCSATARAEAGTAADTGGCPSVILYFARGSGQKLAEAPTGFSVPGQQMFEAVARRYRPGAVASIADPYLALSVKSFFEGLYGLSAGNGAETAAQNLTDLRRLCPASWLVLGGYSQGAQAIRTALPLLDQAVRERIAAVTLFGDPYFKPREPYVVALSTFRKGRRRGVLRFSTISAPAIEREFDGRVFSWCRKSDAICQTLGGTQAHKLYAGPEPHNPEADHAEADEAAARIVARLTEVGEPPELPGRTYTVSGACAGVECLLGEWSGPGTGAFRLLGTVGDGEQVAVVCQTTGETARAADGTESAIWDRLSTGNFVSDLYLTTPGVGRFSALLKRCPPLVVSNS
jgi:cutinase